MKFKSWMDSNACVFVHKLRFCAKTFRFWAKISFLQFLLLFRLTSNRRRWTHIFPKGPSGQYQQLHHLPNNQNPEISETLQQISQCRALPQTGSPGKGNKLQTGNGNSPTDEVPLEQIWTATPQTGKVQLFWEGHKNLRNRPYVTSKP